MKKGKSITLLSIICAVMAFLIVMTFARFPVKTNKNYNSVIGAIELDYDVAGGSVYTLTVDKDSAPIKDIDSVVKQIETRLSDMGYNTYSVKAVKDVDEDVADYSIVLGARAVTNEYGEPDYETLNSDIEAVARYGTLKLFGGGSSDPSTEILSDINPIKAAKYKGTYVAGNEISYVTSITFTKEAYKRLAEYMDANSTYYLKITVGDTTLLSGTSPIQKTYFNKNSIDIYTGSESAARQAAMQIRTGGLEYKFTVNNENEIIEKDNGKIFAIATAVVLALSVIAFAVMFRGYGIVAALSLIAFMLLELMMLIAVPGIKLSISGMAGILLATVLTIDGLVITAKRIKEEYESGKMVKPAIKGGYRRSLFPVLNTGIISIIIGILVFAFAPSMLKCFGITFGIGAVIAIFVNLLLSRILSSLIFSINGYKESFLNLKRNA